MTILQELKEKKIKKIKKQPWAKIMAHFLFWAVPYKGNVTSTTFYNWAHLITAPMYTP